jgi:hypothetical protein
MFTANLRDRRIARAMSCPAICGNAEMRCANSISNTARRHGSRTFHPSWRGTEQAKSSRCHGRSRSPRAITPTVLRKYEPTISTTKAGTDAYLTTATGTGTGYTLTATSVATGDKFTLARVANGTLARSSTIPTKTSRHGGCHSVSGTKGTW